MCLGGKYVWRDMMRDEESMSRCDEVRLTLGGEYVWRDMMGSGEEKKGESKSGGNKGRERGECTHWSFNHLIVNERIISSCY